MIATSGKASKIVELPPSADTLVAEVSNIQGVPLLAQGTIEVTPLSPEGSALEARARTQSFGAFVMRPVQRRFGPFAEPIARGPRGRLVLKVGVSSTGVGVLVNVFGEVPRPVPFIGPR